jgi:hypothetical protein
MKLSLYERTADAEGVRDHLVAQLGVDDIPATGDRMVVVGVGTFDILERSWIYSSGEHAPVVTEAAVVGVRQR